MKSLTFSFSKSALFVILIGSSFSYGCNSSGNTDLEITQPKDQSSYSTTQETNIYRYLSAIEDAYPDKDSLTSLCIRQHGFKLELPKQSVRSAHNIRLPSSEEWSETKQIVIQNYRTEVKQPPSVNGIVMNPVEKTIPYNESKIVEVTKEISGTCIGI